MNNENGNNEIKSDNLNNSDSFYGMELPKTINSNDNSPQLVSNFNNENGLIVDTSVLESDKLKKEDNVPLGNNSNNLNAGGSGTMLLLAILGLIVICGTSIMTAYFKSLYILIVVPVYLLIGTMFSKNKDFSTSLLLGGMFGAVVLFILSITKNDYQDQLTYLSIECVVLGIISCLISSLLFNVFHNLKNVKGIEILGILILIGGVSYGSYYSLKNYQSFINEYILCNSEVVASNEKDFIKKTLENRYGVVVFCDTDLIDELNIGSAKFNGIELGSNQLSDVTKRYDQSNKRNSTFRYCSDSSKNVFSVESFDYIDDKYVVSDTYLDVLLLNNFRDDISSNLKSLLGANDVIVRLYPSKACYFVGDCADVDEYFENYEFESDYDNRYNYSYELKFDKYIDMDAIDFANVYGFKYQISVSGNYSVISEDMLYLYIDKIFEYLNSSGIKNINGFEITFYDVTDDALKKEMLSVVGDSNSENKFLDYEKK